MTTVVAVAPLAPHRSPRPKRRPRERQASTERRVSALIDLVLAPAGAGKFRAMVGSAAITRPTRQPLLDGARALLALGYAPETRIAARHAGSTIVTVRSTVGEAARWTIEDADRGGLRNRLWKARSSWDGAPKTATEDAAAILVAAE
jgi:hypothetical protein